MFASAQGKLVGCQDARYSGPVMSKLKRTQDSLYKKPLVNMIRASDDFVPSLTQYKDAQERLFLRKYE